MRLRPLLALTLAAAVGPASAAAPNLISNVEVKDEGGGLRVVIRGSRPASFTTFSMADPPRFVIDVAGAEFKGVPHDIAVEGETIQVIKNLALQGESGPVARIMLAFRGEVDPPAVAAAGNSLLVTVARRQGQVADRAPTPAAGPSAGPRADAPTAPAGTEPASPSAPPAVAAAADASVVPSAPSAGAPAAPDPGAEPTAVPHPRKRRGASRAVALRLEELGFRQTDAASRIFMRISAAPRYRIVEEGEKKLRVELPHTSVARPNDRRFLDTSYFPSAVALVVPRREGSSTVLEITLREKVQYQQRVEGDTLSIDFEKPGAPARAPAAIGAEKAPATGE
jgi:hypothetical protein